MPSRMAKALLTVMSGAPTFTQSLIAKIGQSSIVAYWDINDASGATMTDIVNARNGAYSNVTLAQTGIGDGKTSGLWVPASSSYGNLYSAALAAAFNAAEGSAILFAKARAASVWTDGVERYLLRLRADANNTIFLSKTAGSVLSWNYVAGGTAEQRNLSVSDGNWHKFGLTWSKSGDVVRAFVDNAQVGADMTTLGTWVGALADVRTILGASINTGVNAWDGNLAHCVICSTPLSVAVMNSIVPL